MQSRPLTGQSSTGSNFNRRAQSTSKKLPTNQARPPSQIRTQMQQNQFTNQKRGQSNKSSLGFGNNDQSAPLDNTRQLSQRRQNDSQMTNTMQSIDQGPPMLLSNNKFRIAMPATTIQTDVSGRYWNQISNQINQDKLVLKDKLASQRLGHGGSSTNLLQGYSGQKYPTHLLNIPNEQDFKKQTLSPLGSHFTKNDFENIQKPFSFLANVGGKETTQAQFTTKVDKNLLKQQQQQLKTISGQIQADPIQNVKAEKQVEENLEKQNKATLEFQPQQNENITIYTQMNVDKHDFDIRDRRNAQRAVSATQRPQSTSRSNIGSIALPSLANQKQLPTIQPQLHRPISGMIPPTQSHKILNNQQQQQILVSQGSQKQFPKDFKISKRPFSANPKYLQIAGFNRPISAQIRMGEAIRGNKENKENIASENSEEEDEDELDDQYIDLNIQEVPEEDKFGMEAETFSQRIMNSRPTTAYKKDKTIELPYPELFDRSERTFAATFAKYGDLSYYTPVQRIGQYMDFSGRLKRRHLMDLIAYMKTSKAQIKPADEEANETEQAHKDFIESCLFIGVMPEEELQKGQLDIIDKKAEQELASKSVFDSTQYKFDGEFQYQKVWSEVLIQQVQSSVHRFNKYIESADAIKNQEISKYKKDWMSHALDLIPDTLLQTFPNEVRKLFAEVFASYSKAMKQSILQYILLSPDERKRLHILMIPRPVPTASLRQALAGGYSTLKYAGSHARKLETENEIKLRLLNNNVVISALHSWCRDFRTINLVELKGLSQFVIENEPGIIGNACYTIDFDSFIMFQEAFRQKTLHLMKHIWHRGCMMIVKKFKFLRTREQQQELQPGKQANGKWTYAGFNAKPDVYNERQWISQLRWEDVNIFKYSDKQTLLQKYFMRTAAVHQHVHLHYFLTEEGFEVNAIPENNDNDVEVEDLVDVRENSAYIAFVSMIGGYINFEENGYEILAKEYKRELKYAAGNLMKIQLRSFVDKSVDTFLNFFKGFVTLEQIKKSSGGKPLRILRPLITKDNKNNFNLEQQHKIKQEQLQVKANPKLAAQIAKRKEEASRKQTEKDVTTSYSIFDEEPLLKFPDFMDYQDFVNPVFRLNLTLTSSNQALGVLNISTSAIHSGENIEFTKKESDIIDDFEAHFYRIVTSFNDFNRPEFSKIKLVSKKRYADDLEEENRQKKMTVQIKKSTGQLKNNNQTSFIGGSQNVTMLNSSLGVGSLKLKDIETSLYKGHEDGQDIYKKYMGRIQVVESARQTKDLIDENNLGVFSKPYIDKKYNIAQPEEACYQLALNNIKKILIKHLKEARRVTELYDQFDSVIKGVFSQKVKEFLKEDRREREYEIILKEIKYYLKLSMQLPSIVFFAMFEVGTQSIKDEIQRRLKHIQAQVFKKFESQVALKSSGICEKYTQICKFLEKQLKNPYEVVDMDKYKNNLLLEMGNLQEKMYENRKSIFFLMNNDKMFEEDTWSLIQELHLWPSKLNQHMDVSDERHRNERNEIENQLIRRREVFELEIATLEENIQEVSQWGDLYAFRMIIDKILDYQQQIEVYEDAMQLISQEEMMLFGFKSGFDGYTRIKRFFTPFNELWTNVNEIMVKKRKWIECPLIDIDPDEVDSMIKVSIKTLQKLQKQLQDNSLAQKVLHSMGQEIGDLNELLPTIEVLCNPSLKQRHWNDIQRVANAQFNHKQISLNEIKYFNIKEYLDQLAEISEKAKKENRLEKMLDKMENEWKDLRFEMTTFRDSGIPILQGQNIEEVQLLLDEHTLNAQTIRSSADVAPMEERANNWERLMVFLQEVLEVWIRVQANYLYLEPIFHSEDIIKKLPLEAQEFFKIDKVWKDIMNKVQQDTLVLNLKKVRNIQENLEESSSALDRIQKSLNDYLETKRQYFPRFYFLSNEDLLEILGESKKPQKVQRHLKKCFEGINEIVFKSAGKDNEGDEEIVAIVSREQERIELTKNIFPHDYKGNVEQWLLELETQMKLSVQQVINDSMIDHEEAKSQRPRWISNWQGQVVLVVSQIIWTRQIEKALLAEGPKGLRAYFVKTQSQLEEIVNLVRQDLPVLMRMTLGSLIVVDVHAKDVLESLISENVATQDDFLWLSQLRYYFNTNEKHVQAKMITTVQDYGYEYLGNTGRLVITPLTDRCYRTLMSALHLNLGGAPEGPAGTGKTESTKDLAKAIGVHCMVFNCAEGLNAKAMAKFFKGLASAGSWSCFDEFNRIDLEVLSVVAQQILEIQRAKNQLKTSFKFEDTDIILKPSCNIFITMNPGYAGRSELPDNLKALFRPVAMMIPDYTMIAEISLYSFGFLESRNLAKKIVATYRLCSEQLSSQYHYDYGMRAVKAVLTAAKGLKQKFVDEREDVLILRSINDVNLPKFLAHDIPLFEGIIEDLFQGISLPAVQYGSLSLCIKKAMKEYNLQEIAPFMQFFKLIYLNFLNSEKVFQLYEMINCRHGLMLVGPPFGAKTCSYQVLARALTLVSKEDPSFGELPVDLYGSFDPISQDFTDGILGQIFRKCAYKDVGKSRRWIIFDGPVDAEWIENMNTVLDDNKKLCLMNGEVIMMNDQMNLIFETHDLSQASPATVSRCGMVYLQPENIGLTALLNSWIEVLKIKTRGSQGESLDPSLIKRIEDLFEIFFSETAQFLKKKCTTYVPIAEVQLGSSLMKIFQSLLQNVQFLDFCYNPKVKNEDIVNRVDMYFLFSLSWSVGAVSDEQGQKAFSQFLRKISAEVYKLKGNKSLKLDKNTQIPDGGLNVQSYFIEDQRWINWKEVLDRHDSSKALDSQLTYHELIVPTTENLKNSYILNLCVKNNMPVLFIGPTGTGKSVTIQKYLRALPYETYTTAVICFSSKTSANQTQEIIDSKLEKRGRRVMGPPLGKKCVIFIDDLNLPQLGKYGAQPPIELLRQWMDHKGWYDHKEKEKQFKELIDLVFVSAMGPPGGGKNPVTPRYLRHFNLISINNFEEIVLQRIFSKLMDWHIKRENFNSQEVIRALQGVVSGAVDIFLFAQSEFKPTPAKSHYLFNLRDLSRVIQGIQMVRKEELLDSKKVLRLWVHEIARVFSDRLISETDQSMLYARLSIASRDKIKEDLQLALKVIFDEKKFHVEGNKEIMTKYLLYGDVLGDGLSTQDRKFDEIAPKQRNLLTERMNGFLEDFNSVSKKPMNLVLFDFAIMHVLRIGRILRMARGNAILIGVGGSGRQSLSKLATFICDYDMVETEQTKNYNIDQWREDMKRLLLLTGQDNKNSVFLLSDSQMKHGFMLEDINNLLNSGEIPNLFQAEEKQQMYEKLRPQAKKAGRMDLYNNGSNEQFQDYFVEKTKSHLHIILAMSPIGTTIRERIRNFPSLVNCCTIDWYTVWPSEALEAVADKFLQEVDVEPNERLSIIYLCKKMHTDMIELSSTYLQEQKRNNYVTPTSYLELIQTYKDLLRQQRQKTLSFKLGYDKGIEKLLFTAEEIQKMQQDLNEKQPKLEQMTRETDALIIKIQEEARDVVEPKKLQIQEEEAIANQMAQEAQTIKIECDNDLSKALPLVKKAQEALNTIQPSHINEVKSLGKPPEAIKKVLHAVCVMCQRKAEKTPKKENPKELEENWWYTSQKFMSEKNFLEQLLDFDKDHIPETVINKIRTLFLTDPDFKPQRVEKASFAAKGLCMWVRALDQYDRVAKIIAPKRARAKEAEMKYRQTLEGLKFKQSELRDIVEQFEILQAHLDETGRKKQQLQEDIEDCSRKLSRAQTLLTGLGGEQKRWEEATILLGKQYQNLVGDVLIAASIISYLGSFTGHYRNNTIKYWLAELKSQNLNASITFNLQLVLGEPVTIRKWNLSGLPTDNFSVDNGIIVFNSRRWPLMIDPQGQANRWIKTHENTPSEKDRSSNKLNIVKLSDSDIIRVMEQCIQLGYPVLLENIGEELDPILEPLLLKQTFKSAGVVSINFGENIIEYSPEFRLYITTKHSNPHYLPELSTKVTIINFMITYDGLKDQLLNLVVQKENSALDEERSILIVQSYENKKQLKDIENRILEVLRTSQGNILDDEKAIDVLKQSQELSNEIKEKQEIAEVTEGKIEEARKLYDPIAEYSSLLFFIIQKLSNVDVMYQYSLTWFISLFLMAIEKSEKSEFIEQRIESLKNYFTYSLYTNVCRSLFEKHKLLFSFILTAKVKEADGKVAPTSYSYLISTVPGLENPLGLVNPSENWLPNNIWNKLCDLVKTNTTFKELLKNFRQDEQIWRKIYESDNPMREEFPCNDEFEQEQLDIFTKLCLIKVFRPDKLIPAVKEYVISQMGENYVSSPPFDLEKSYNDSNQSTPLIFVLPGADPLQSLTAFAQSKKKLDSMKTISLGQDQGPKAEKAIEEARLKGGWVLLQNCHLYPSWMPRLERICEQLEMKTGTKDQAHPSFRLWLTSYPSQDFPILILQNGIKMTNEPPKGLKANMIGSYKLEPISDHSFFDIHSKPEVFKKLTYGLCMFHAIIQERRNYGALGWNIRYDFTVSDLQISVKQLHLFTNEYKDVPLIALKYLTGECNYGGRVTDERDRRVLKALLEDFYSSQIQQQEFCAFNLGDYMIPNGNLHHQKYLEHIQRMPLEEPPALFGFHPNANITKNLKETEDICYDLIKMGEIEGVKNKSNKNTADKSKKPLQRSLTRDKSYNANIRNTENITRPEIFMEKVCKDILSKLPSLYDIDTIQSKYPIMRENSMNTVLVQELQRFNQLLSVILGSLKNILLALKGEVLLSEQLEKVYNSLLIGEIPALWLTASYPSLKPVASYIKDFCNRLATFNSWINNGPPNIFWISGFFFTQSFLTGVLQNYARRYKVEIDTLVFDFTFRQDDTTDYDNEIYVNDKLPENKAPVDGAFISGLYLEGARWDSQTQALAESHPKVLFSKVPIIWLKPIRYSKLADQECYECPMYKTGERKGVLSTTGHSTNFILNVRVPLGSQTSTHWIKRGVAMLCQLSN